MRIIIACSLKVYIGIPIGAVFGILKSEDSSAGLSSSVHGANALLAVAVGSALHVFSVEGKVLAVGVDSELNLGLVVAIVLESIEQLLV